MSYFDWLANGSQFHKAERSGSSLKISPINDTPECLVEFQEIVRKAQEISIADGYHIKPHKSSRLSIHGHPEMLYDFAAICCE